MPLLWFHVIFSTDFSFGLFLLALYGLAFTYDPIYVKRQHARLADKTLLVAALSSAWASILGFIGYIGRGPLQDKVILSVFGVMLGLLAGVIPMMLIYAFRNRSEKFQRNLVKFLYLFPQFLFCVSLFFMATSK